jgi:uncharacterized membrane protein YbhN (UPF0104 family)
VTLAERAAGPLKAGVCILCACLFLRALRDADLSLAGRFLAASGPWMILGILPFGLAQGLDTEAWRLILARLGSTVRLRELFPVRVAVEAMTLSMPAGVVVAESVAPRLLERIAGIRPSSTVAAAATKRWLTMRAHAVYVAVGAVAGLLILREQSGAYGSLRYGPFVVLASALLPLGASVAMSSALSSGSRISGLHALLVRVPLPALRGWLVRRREAFVATDAGFAALAREGKSSLVSTLLLVAAWLLESVETFVLLRMAGAHLSLVMVLSFEAGLSVLRSGWFFAPAGLGALDMGYMAVLRMVGVPDATSVGAAFLVLKRGRELVWIAFGYGWMALRRSLGGR